MSPIHLCKLIGNVRQWKSEFSYIVVITVSIGIDPIIGLNSKECSTVAEGVKSIRTDKKKFINFFLSKEVDKKKLFSEICKRVDANEACSSSSNISLLHRRIFSIISKSVLSRFNRLICLVVFLRTGKCVSTLNSQKEACSTNKGAQSCPEMFDYEC